MAGVEFEPDRVGPWEDWNVGGTEEPLLAKPSLGDFDSRGNATRTWRLTSGSHAIVTNKWSTTFGIGEQSELYPLPAIKGLNCARRERVESRSPLRVCGNGP